jgi:hypothetical protein
MSATEDHGPQNKIWGADPCDRVHPDSHSHSQLGCNGSASGNPIQVGTNRTNRTGDPIPSTRRIKPATTGGTLRRLIEDSHRQTQRLNREIRRLEQAILDLKADLAEENDRRKDLTALLDQWTDNVEAATGERPQ